MSYSRLLVAALVVTTVATPSSAQISANQVRQSIDRGINYLKRTQSPQTGRWQDAVGTPAGGVTALCTLALLNSGLTVDDPSVKAGMRAIRESTSEKTYTVALETMALCIAEPQRDRPQIDQRIRMIQRSQISTNMPYKGAWGYDVNGKNTVGDPSNTQFALLALYEAERAGLPVEDTIWKRSLGYWARRQRPNGGGWNYRPDDAVSGSMTCAGIASTIIARGQVTLGDARVRNNEVLCCQPQEDLDGPKRGLEWLGRNFSVSSNPTARNSRNQDFRQIYLYYYLYALERVGRLTANRFIGQHDWYREGAELLVNSQDRATGAWKGSGIEENQQIATSLALLFLSKGRRPVLIAKLDTNSANDDWNRHRSDLAHLTRYVESRWKRDLTWQVIDGNAASVEDLLQTPVLYISGRDGLRLSQTQKDTLKAYVENGGFIFAESCCDDRGFDRDFKQLMAELFPENALRLLPPDHPIWYAEQKVPAKYLRQLMGVEACCRTSVVYCPGKLSCYWELASNRQSTEYPDELVQEIKATLAIGANVLTYATNRELKDKLDAPQLVTGGQIDLERERGTLYVAKLRHNGGSDDAPAALKNLLELAEQNLQLRVGQNRQLLSATAEDLFDYPVLFVHGRRNFRLNESERKALAQYVRRGGFIMADSICASEAFTESFRREIKTIFPEQTLERLPPTHPVFSTDYQGYDLRQVSVQNPRGRAQDGSFKSRTQQQAPTLEGLEVDGRLVVVFSPLDLSCALENQASIECHGYAREDAAKLGINILLYAMGR